MTLPDERYRSVLYTRKFLMQLAGGEFPRVPKAVRAQASSCLRHFPSEWELDRLAHACPDIVVKHMEEVHRFIAQGAAALGQVDYAATTPLDKSS